MGSVEGDGRVLWLSDTFGDKNGISTVLKAIHHEIRLRKLPVDLMVCGTMFQTEDNLIALKPVSQFTLPLYRNQPLRIPNIFSILRIFRERKYTRIICSTEGPMGWVALYLKRKFSVETSFFLHTDWITFAREVLSIEQHGLNRIERILKAYYKRFNNIIVLNTDQQQWLTGNKMGFAPSRVFMSAHWADEIFSCPSCWGHEDYPFNLQLPVILFTGRLSKEKGVFELPGIFRLIRSIFPEIQMVLAGTGPAEGELKKLMPEAFFLGWVKHDKLPSLFHASDILILPSRFDTFSCVALEALSCGLPVAAYNTKGPKDIIQDSVNGFLVETPEEMAGTVVKYFLDPAVRMKMKKEACLRAEVYQAGPIMDRLLQDIGLVTETNSL
ncbi:MAG: glycosyltransferase [Bacteroidales bacterium]|jgi:glycosyltransferase involved in cell wall biosynthesis|nr:glycosyltransferase [Bacteroidales bacterium]